MNLGDWNDYSCSLQHEYICQIYTSDTHPKPELDKSYPPSGGCKPGWWKMGKLCFRTFGEKGGHLDEDVVTKDWNEANTYCSQTWPGATLAQFPNENYQYFASSMLRNFGNDVWIGGLKTTSDNTFHWQDGNRMTFSFWAEGEPNNWDGEEDKIQMSWYSDNQYATRDPGQWNDADGGIPMGFMCTHKLDSTIPDEPASSVACPAGFIS